jgi:hypothetical protein
MPRARLVAGIGTIILIGVALLGPVTGVASAKVAAPAKGILPPKHPSKSLKPDPDFLDSPHCYDGQDNASCNSLVLKAIARARRKLEHLGGMSFSLKAYEKLSPDEQIFVTANLERIARGLPPAVVLTKSLDKIAQVGARKDEDPPLNEVPTRLPGGGRWSGLGGNWAAGWDNALGSDYAWMYDDGLGSSNIDCTKSDRAGCWGHRDNILGTFDSSSACGGEQHELAMGTGHVEKSKLENLDSETELFVGVCGPTPTGAVLTWSKAKALLHIKG